MFKRKLAAGLSLSALLLTGCGASSDIVVTTGSAEKVVEHYINEYNDTMGKDYSISWEPISDNYQETLSTRLAGGSDVCVMAMDYTLLPQLVEAGRIVALDDYIEDGKADTFVDSVYDSFNYEGKQYGFPLDYNTLAVFYNKDMLDAAGVAYPDETWTWADYNEAFAKIAPTIGEQEAVFTAGNEYHRWYELALAAGGSLVDENGELNFTDEGVVAAYDAWMSLFDNGYFTTSADLGVDWGGQAMFEEKTAFTIEGSWTISSIAGGNPDLNYGVAPIPLYTESSEHNTMIYSNALAISSDCDNKDGAYEFIDWFTSDEMAKKRSDFQVEQGTSSGGMPSTKIQNAEYLEMYPEFEIFAEGGEYGSSSGVGLTYDQTIINNINKVLEESQFDTSLDSTEQLQKAQDKVAEEAGV